jgi:hypothetical protein
MTMQGSGNATDRDSFQTLMAVLYSGSFARKRRAAQLLAEIGAPDIATLLDASADDNRIMRVRALKALGALFRPEANLYQPGGSRDSRSPSPPSASFFSNGQRSRVVYLLIDRMHHDVDEECRIMAAASLMKIGDRSGLKEVRRGCLQQGRAFEGQILDLVWGTSEAPGNDMPDTLQPPRTRRERRGASSGRDGPW